MSAIAKSSAKEILSSPVISISTFLKALITSLNAIATIKIYMALFFINDRL